MLKKWYFFILLLVFVFFPFRLHGEERHRKALDIVFPLEGQAFPYITHSMIFGSTLPGSRLSINNTDVKVHENGAFFAFLPVEVGNFTFHARSQSPQGEFEDTKTIKIAPEIKSIPPDIFDIQMAFMQPAYDIVAPLGEEILFRFMGTPGKQGFFRFEGEEKRFPLQEIEFQDYQGVYEGSYAFYEGFPDKKNILFELFDGDEKIASRKCPQTLWIRKDFPEEVFETTEDFVKGRSFPESGYKLLLQKGVRLKETGILGPYIRLKLSEREDIYVEKKDLIKVEKPGALPIVPVGNIQVRSSGDYLYFVAACPRNLAYLVEEKVSDKALSLYLYCATGNVDRIINEKYKTITSVTFQQVEQDVFRIDIVFPFKPLWGWSTSFSGGNVIFKIRKPPVVKADDPLRGIKVCLDAGHNPGPGAVGPTRLEESEINWIIAERARRLLEKDGASVIMTRKKKSSEASLRDRVKKACESDSQLFLSIHNNSVSNGKDAYEASGTETYFYTPSSRIFAECIHGEILKATQLKDGGVRFGNFAVLRNPSLPCVLIEAVYIILPEQESLLRDENFQESVALQITTGIKMFLLKEANVL